MIKEKYSDFPGSVCVTAATGMIVKRILLQLNFPIVLGIAAHNIGGITIHSFAGIGFGHEPAEALAKNIWKGSKPYERWICTKVLVIDEG